MLVTGRAMDDASVTAPIIKTSHVAGVHLSATHTFSKASVEAVTLVAGLGIDGDAHAGAQVKHRSRVAKDPTQPNLRQVLLFPVELLDDLGERGYDVAAGALGENITTAGLDIFGLPTGTVMRLGTEALIVLTGLRNPCGQINGLQDGLLGELRTTVDGETVRRGGVMAVVVHGGDVRTGDPISISLPPGEPIAMQKV